MVAPAPTTLSALALRSAAVNFSSLTSKETELASAETCSSKLAGPTVILTGYSLPRSSVQFGEESSSVNPSPVFTKLATISSSSLRVIEQRSNLSPLNVASISHGPTMSVLASSAANAAVSGAAPKAATATQGGTRERTEIRAVLRMVGTPSRLMIPAKRDSPDTSSRSDISLDRSDVSNAARATARFSDLP